MNTSAVAQLARQLEEARGEFSAALAEADPELLTAPGLLGEWSAREVVAHLAHWTDWGSTCLEAASEGRLDALGSDDWDVDAQNADVARAAASQTMAAVRDREAVAYERFLTTLEALDPALLDAPAPWGGTVETIVLENGPEHYAEHAAHVRAWFAGSDAGDDDEDEA
jgi:uncharacterized damage-inducible protein DinB